LKIAFPSSKYGVAHCDDHECQDKEHAKDNEKWQDLLGDVDITDGKLDFE